MTGLVYLGVGNVWPFAVPMYQAKHQHSGANHNIHEWTKHSVIAKNNSRYKKNKHTSGFYTSKSMPQERLCAVFGDRM